MDGDTENGLISSQEGKNRNWKTLALVSKFHSEVLNHLPITNLVILKLRKQLKLVHMEEERNWLLNLGSIWMSISVLSGVELRFILGSLLTIRLVPIPLLGRILPKGAQNCPMMRFILHKAPYLAANRWREGSALSSVR